MMFRSSSSSSSSFALTWVLLLAVSDHETTAFAPTRAVKKKNCQSSSNNSNSNSNSARHALPDLALALPPIQPLQGAGAAVQQAIQGAQSAYTYCLNAYQIPTQMATFGAFSATGDAIAQNVQLAQEDENENNDENKSQQASSSSSSSSSTTSSTTTTTTLEYDPARTFRFLLKGLGGGVVWNFWYNVVADPLSLQCLQQLGVQAGSEWEQPARVATSIVLEQFVACPVAYACWDIPVPALLSGQATSWKDIPNQVRAKLAPLLIANAKVWTPVNIVTYSLPAEWRLLFVSVCELLWQSVNSQITNHQGEELEALH